MDIALLIVRLVVGLALAAHGAQKLFGWFGGYGLAGTAGFFEQLGWKPGRLFVLGASAGEIGGGLLTALGLFGALGPALIVMVMVAAIFSVHISKGFWQTNGGYELNLAYIAASILVAFNLGVYSLDHVLGLTILTDPVQVWIALAAGAVLGFLNTLARRPAPATQNAATQ
jgi:putative oxidoreductase